MQFVYLDTDDELRRMMEGDFAAWRTYLHPTQRAVAHRETYNGPFRLAGGAGTGKTVVALHRAAFLARRPDARILLCTFTRNLAANLEVDLRSLLTPEQAARVEVRGVDQVVRAVVAAVDGPPGAPLGDREQEALWEEAVRSSAVPPDLAAQLTPSFLAAEYRTVVLGMSERTRAEYLRVKRAGRGVRLNRVQRAAVWNVVEAFERGAQAQGRTSYDLLSARAEEILADPELREKVATYDHVIVDEGQDLHAGHWRILRGLVAPGAERPVPLRGRPPAHLRRPAGAEQAGHRDPGPLPPAHPQLPHLAAEPRLRPRCDRRGEGRRSRRRRGDRRRLPLDLPRTRARHCAVSRAPPRRCASSPRPSRAGSTPTSPRRRSGCSTRRAQEQDRARLALQEAGVAVELLQRDGPGNNQAIKIASMHRAKGTEFSRVIVVGAEAGVVPLDWVFETQPEADHPAVRGRERSLFYVACSRARDELVVTWAGAPSPFIPALTA